LATGCEQHRLSLHDSFSAGSLRENLSEYVATLSKLPVLDGIMLMLVVIAFLLAGGYANLCNNLLKPSDGDANPSLSS